jgi:hypothetical protein
LSLQKLPLILACTLSICMAQTEASKPSEPEALGVFFYVDSTTQTLKELPKEDYKKHRGSGWATITDNVKVAGAGSSFHITSNDKITFVIRTSQELAQKAKLFQFTVKDGNREYQLGKWHRRDFQENPGLPLTAAQFGNASFKVTSQSSLEPGEYALTTGFAVYTFTVSAPSIASAPGK